MEISDNYVDYFDHIEKTQRVSLFLNEVLNRGTSMEDAARITKDALYDWNSEMSSIEEKWLSRFAMFWSFQRRAMLQAMDIMTEPFRTVAKDRKLTTSEVVWSTSLIGSEYHKVPRSQFTNLTHMKKSMTAAKTASREAAAAQEPEESDEELLRVLPWWFSGQGTRAALGVKTIDPKYAAYLKSNGIDHTHMVSTIPTLTPIEMTETLQDLVGATLIAIGAMTSRDFERFRISLAKPLRQVADMGGPITGGAADMVLGKYVHEDKAFHGDKVKVKKMYDRVFFNMLGKPGIVDVQFNDKNEMLVDSKLYSAYKMAPPLSADLARYLEPLMQDPVDRMGAVQGSMWVARQYLGLKDYTYNAENMPKHDVKAVKRQVDKELKGLKASTLSSTAKERNIFGEIVGGDEDPEVGPDNPFVLAPLGDLPPPGGFKLKLPE